MLKFFRRRDFFVRMFLGFFLVVICGAMVLYLIPSSNGIPSGPAGADDVAVVDGVKITAEELNAQITAMAQGQDIPASIKPLFGKQALSQLVSRQVLLQQAEKMGISVSDADVAQTARLVAPQLYPNGRYVGDAQASQMIGQLANMTLTGFESQLRDGLTLQKLQNLVTDPIQVDKQDVDRQFSKEFEKAKFDYALINPDDLDKDVPITDAALQAYYKQNQAKYMTQEKRALEVILANQDQLGAAIQITDAQVDNYYRQNMATFNMPERVRLAHIVFKTTGADGKPLPAADMAKARAAADDALKQLKAGADFATLAKRVSQDASTAAQGGELGFIQRGQAQKTVEDVAFSLPPGQISGVIQTDLDLQIVRVETHDPAHLQTEVQVHDQIVQQMQKNIAADQAQRKVNQAQSMAQSKVPFAQIASQLGLQYFKTQPITRSDPVTGVGVSPDFANAVFTTATGGSTTPIAVAQGFAIAKVTQIFPPVQQSFDDAKATITADYRQQQAAQLAKTRAQQMSDAAQKQGLKVAAAAMHATVKTSDFQPRDGTVADLGSISSFGDALFQLHPGQSGGPVAVANKQLIYSLDSLQEPTAADIALQYKSVQDDILRKKRDEIFSAYSDSLVAALTKSGKIKVNDSALTQALGGGDTGGSPSPFPGSGS